LSEVLAQFLSSRQLLLVLDNCEHLISGCARLAYDLLTHCAGLKVLATSREALDITGELAYQVPALSLPRPDQQTLADLLLEFESIRLFVERAYFKSGFVLSELNAIAVLQICRRLDGIPLALELAAARTRVLSAEQIAERLIDRFHLLTHGSRTALPRQQTLRATLDWSYDLLSEKEQVLFRRLAVFAGGWTLDAARAVCAGAGIEGEAVLDTLTDLVHRSLVSVQEHEDETRYQMLETIGAYAREKLAAAAETESFCALHRDWFLRFAEEVYHEHRTRSSPKQLDRMAREHDNIRAALNWSLLQAQVVPAFRFTYLLAYFWDIRAYWSEGRAWIDRALRIANFDSNGTGPQGIALWAQALCSAGRLAVGQRDFAAAEQALTKGVGLYRQLALARGLGDDETEDMGIGLNYLGFCAHYQGDYARATALYEQALALYQAVGGRVGIGFTLTMLGRAGNYQGQYGQAARLGEEGTAIGRVLGHVHLTAAALDVTGRALYLQGEFQRAQSLLEESLALSRDLDFHQDVVDVLNVLGLVEFYQGNHRPAMARLEAGLALAQTITYSMGRACSLSTQAEVALAEGSPARAKRLLAESLAAFRQLGLKWYLIRCLELQAASDAAERQPVRAARLFGAAAAAREALSAPLPPPDRPAYDGAVALTRAQLGNEAFAVAWDGGRIMPLDQAVEYALEASK
jgi:predicted ATPase